VRLPERATPGRPHGTRVRGTRQAEAVTAVLDRLPGFSSAQQIHAELRERGEPVGLTTVCRHLPVLTESGPRTRSGTVERWADEAARQAGFSEVGHTVELFGLCPDCGH